MKKEQIEKTIEELRQIYTNHLDYGRILMAQGVMEEIEKLEKRLAPSPRK